MNLKSQLERIIEPGRVLTRPIDLIAYASDASFYRLIPKAVVQPKTISEIQRLFEFSQSWQIPLTFRAAGTSLSGQAISDGILVDISKHWRKVTVESAGKQVRVQPGVIGGRVNQHLKSHLAKLGPDPASINSCMMGGILANNASGMCCGVAQNSYHTLASLAFVLPNGLFMDTADPKANDLFLKEAPEIAQGLLRLKSKIESNPKLKNKIRTKYRSKNTNGYSLNAFLDFTTPVEIMQHLLIGSEGTLGFIAEAVLNTVPDYPLKYTGLLFFPSIQEASAAILPLKDSGASALEVMDRAALRSVEQQEGIPSVVAQLPDEAAALLVEYQTPSEAELAEVKAKAESIFRSLTLLHNPIFTQNPAEQAALWKIRKGLFPSIGAVRKLGTTVIIEDVAFPVEKLAEAVTDLQELFKKHEYENAIIFGHAKDGNLHFVLTQSFNEAHAIRKYEAFMDDLVNLVVQRYDGALKGEHGTGRNMAPFVETEWGGEAYEIMKALKSLMDPMNLLNPGVIINQDPKAHVSHLKSLPLVDATVDKCIECGFCEPHCPSRDLTLTPRQRIVVQREIARLENDGANTAVLHALIKDFQYAGMDTCAIDGLCATAWPVDIDTGQLIKRFRRDAHGPKAQHLAKFLSRNFKHLERFARIGLRLGQATQFVVGSKTTLEITKFIQFILRTPMPKWMAEMPKAASGNLPKTAQEGAAAVYFPTCISRTMGALPGEPAPYSLAQTFVILAERAGVAIWIPRSCVGTCCGMPFSSKGYHEAYVETINRTVDQFWEWSDRGKRPVVIDTSSCTYTLKNCRPDLKPENQTKFDKLVILDSIEFVHDYLLPKLEIQRLNGAVALHPICSVTKMNLTEKFKAMASACANSVTIPMNLGCCGFAGDRGLLFPELTESATRAEAEEVCSNSYNGYYSSGRTCELGLARATGKPYQSFLYLVEKASREN
jgi:D-lactate dehydrogenase